MSNTTWATQILKQYWGYDSFRGIQLDIITSIAARQNTLGLMPTGGGKSITFQVPALAMEGVCIVVTPLIALMKDQVIHLRQRNITAAAIHSGLSREELLLTLDNAVLGAYKFLYVSPERLITDLFRTKVSKMHVCFITVDEAHCISQWGHDFRPSYLRIAEVLKLLPNAPILALTATATEHVVEDICHHLTSEKNSGSASFTVYRMSFARANLHYIVRHTNNKEQELLRMLRSFEGSCIVYTRNRRGTREICEMLKQEGISAHYYHAGLTDTDKDVRQAAWTEGEVRVMVATNAFGMGIDKPDVRLVVHMDIPDSIESYFQEAGRAGRDGNPSRAVLLHNRHDRSKMIRRIAETFPEKDYIRRVYDSLAYYFQLAIGDGYNVRYEFSLEQFCINFKFFPVQALSALQILSYCGYIDYRSEDESISRLLFLTHRDDLYQLKHLGPQGDAVIRALLRLYGGLFSDYIFIDESRLARECQMTANEVYETLKLLNHIRIVHYIPRKRTAYITYLTRRVASDDLNILPEAYETRREQFTARIQGVLDYVENDDYCRSRFLLEYFGDRSGKDCGRCDVCLQDEEETTPQNIATLERHFLQILSDGQPHSPTEFITENNSIEACQRALQNLVDSERICCLGGAYQKK